MLFFLSGCNDTSKENNLAEAETERKNDNFNESISNYRSSVNTFTSISSDEIREKIDNKNTFVLFVGRESCPYCRIFAPKLFEAISEGNFEGNSEIHYLDSEYASSNEELKSFMESYEIRTVPSVLAFKDGDESSRLYIDSLNITIEDISMYLEKNNRDNAL